MHVCRASVCICMCICMCACIHVCKYICMHVCIIMCVYISMCVTVYMYVYVTMCAYNITFVLACIFVKQLLHNFIKTVTSNVRVDDFPDFSQLITSPSQQESYDLARTET